MNALAPESRVLADFVAGFFRPLAGLMQDPEVSEVLINGPREIYVERKGRLRPAAVEFESEHALLSALRAVAQYLGRPLDQKSPILEGRLPDGSRLQAILSPLVQKGPCVAIRRHRLENVSVDQLLAWGALNEEALLHLRSLIAKKKNILVSGGTGSGKTSLLRCLATLIPEEERIVTIEDARELSLSMPHVVALEARPADVTGNGRVTIRDLFVATLRLRPDRIVIGELRAGEALELIQAMTSGHGGCLSTIHASSPGDALRRLETLALLAGVELPLPALRAQIASAVDVVVQVERCPDGRRWVRSISHLTGLGLGTDYLVRSVFDRVGSGGELSRQVEASCAREVRP